MRSYLRICPGPLVFNKQIGIQLRALRYIVTLTEKLAQIQAPLGVEHCWCYHSLTF